MDDSCTNYKISLIALLDVFHNLRTAVSSIRKPEMVVKMNPLIGLERKVDMKQQFRV